MFKSLSKGDKYGHYAYIFIIPFFVVMSIFIIYPIIQTINLSLTEWDGSILPPKFVGLKNYINLIQDQVFYKSVMNTWIIWIANIIPQMIFGLGLAVILTDRAMKGKGFFRAIYYLPNLITMASIGALVYFLVDWKSGSVNRILMALNIIDEPFYWLQDIFASRMIVSLTSWWMWFGYSMIIFMAGIKAIPEDLFEAARVDGASKWQVFWSITLPLLKPIMLYQVVTSIIGGLSMYDIPFVLSGGTGAPQDSLLTMVMYVYSTAFRNFHYGYGSAIGVGLFVHIVIFVAIAFKFVNPKNVYN